MAKKHKNLENIKIQWNGDLSHPEAGNKNQSIPANVDLGTWGGYVPCWYGGSYTDCVIEDMYFEDFNVITINDDDPEGITLNIDDIVAWIGHGRGDIASAITPMVSVPCSKLNADTNANCPDLAPKNTYTWGDVSFIIEIADGIGTGSRRARETRLNQFEQEKKKRLIRLICRVNGEKVYDEEKVMGDTYIKLEDADLVINEVLGKMRVENANVL